MNKGNLLYCDGHLHLQDSAYDNKIDAIMQVANEYNIKLLACNGTCPADWRKIALLSQKYNSILPCFGVHPWFCNDLPDNWLLQLKKILLQYPSAIGEIGLDRWKEPINIELQQKIFHQQLELALELQRPANIHCLKAWGDLLAALKKYKYLPQGILLHSFAGSTEIMQELLQYNAYFSISGTTLNEKRHKLHKTIKKIPRERLLVETDAPDMLPEPELRIDDNLNQPANIVPIIKGLTKILDIEYDTLAKQLWHNSLAFYKPALDFKP